MRKLILSLLLISSATLVFGGGVLLLDNIKLNLEINTVNSSALSLNPIESISSSVGVERKDIIKPHGFDGTTLTYSLSNNPSFITVEKNGTKTDSFILKISKYAPEGTYTGLVLTVGDNASSASETFTIVIKPQTSGNQKMNIDPVSTGRFSIPQNLVWPTNVGEADVCLWKNDRVAAVTFTIDDNIEGDQSWWLSMQQKYDIDFTWFVIVKSVSKWSRYQYLIDAGNEIQTHDLAINQGHGAINDSTDAKYIPYVVEARDTINKMLTNNNSLTFAYPYGRPKGYVTRDKFIAMRGVTGIMNFADKINYLDINSRSATNDLKDIGYLLDPSKRLWNMKFYRGLASYHYHTVSYGAARTKTEAFISAVAERSDSIWAGKFSEVTRYGQERDTHLLTVDNIATEEIKFTLTDEMNDIYFDYPLTVKIRIENAWKGVKAIQDGKEIDAKIVTKDGNSYALVNAVPDKGQVTISKADELSEINFEKWGFTIYPNPVRGSEINISVKETLTKERTVELVSLSGKTIYKSVLRSGKNNFKIEITKQLNKGIYLLKIGDNKSVITKKIIINN